MKNMLTKRDFDVRIIFNFHQTGIKLTKEDWRKIRIGDG